MKRSWRSLLKVLGPGFVTGASDDDPAGIATYTQAGAGTGFTSIWVMFWILPFMIAVQEMCARIAMATGKGLMQNLRTHTSTRVAWVVGSILFLANTLNVGADLGMMAATLKLVLPIPFWPLLVALTLITLSLQIFLCYATYAKYLKWLCLSLLSYVVVAALLHLNWFEALKATIVPQPQWTANYWLIFSALLGTSISPYLYFWQASQEVEEQTLKGCVIEGKGANPACDWKTQLKDRRADVAMGMLFSNAIAWFIIAAAASTLFAQGITTIDTADQAAAALAPFGGSAAVALFTLGILGTGLLAVPVLTGSAAFAISDVAGWKNGLSRKWHDAKHFYGLIVISTLLGALMNGLNIPPVRFLIYSAVANALVAPIMLLFIVRLADNGRIMGKFKNGKWSKYLGYATVLLMTFAAVMWLVISWMQR